MDSRALKLTFDLEMVESLLNVHSVLYVVLTSMAAISDFTHKQFSVDNSIVEMRYSQ